MKHLFIFLFALTACATDPAPKADQSVPPPWGYEDMCKDPERRTDTLCPPKN